MVERHTPHPMGYAQFSDMIVLRCLPVHYVLLLSGPVFGIICGFVNVHYELSAYIWHEEATRGISLVMVPICWLISTLLVFALYAFHGGCQIRKLTMNKKGIELNTSSRDAKDLTRYLKWDQIVDIQYKRWGLNVIYRSHTEEKKLRMSPIFPFQVDDFMGYAHMILTQREED